MTPTDRFSGVRRYFLPGLSLPIAYEPIGPEFQEPGALAVWVRANRVLFNRDLRLHGAILLRGFPIADAQAFEDVALAADDRLGTAYLGTSPRDRLTKHVFTASELPPAYPIMQHAEMSFLDQPPRKLFFFAKRAPQRDGETPVTDLRQVFRQLDPALRQKFAEKGVRYVRVYDGPSAGSRFSFWKTKRWNEMFSTTDPGEVERIAREQNFQFEWFGADSLRLTNTQVAIREHPENGTVAWHNHSQTFHVDAAWLEYSYILRRTRSLRAFGVFLLIGILTALKKIFRSADRMDVNALYGDGTPIPAREIRAIQKIFWENLAIFPWQTGDILVIDNYSVSHGRLPFKGPREILVAWAE